MQVPDADIEPVQELPLLENLKGGEGAAANMAVRALQLLLPVVLLFGCAQVAAGECLDRGRGRRHRIVCYFCWPSLQELPELLCQTSVLTWRFQPPHLVLPLSKLVSCCPLSPPCRHYCADSGADAFNHHNVCCLCPNGLCLLLSPFSPCRNCCVRPRC